jgi:N utilization substance protein B
VGRRQARELAFRTLFQSERGAEPLLDVWRSVRAEQAEVVEDADDAVYGDALDVTDLEFAGGLLKSFDAHREELNAELAAAITGWSFGQMSQTDLNVLRIALTEMRHGTEPPEVAIEMAVRLAKKFGGDESGRFVNGVLAKLLREQRGAMGVDPREPEPVREPEDGDAPSS